MIYAIQTLPLLFFAASAPSLAQPTLCQKEEHTVLYGQVQDDFGLDVSICTSKAGDGERLTVRWQGEGGGDKISCSDEECKGKVGYSRYSSPNLTILTLAWRKGDHVQRLTQTLSRADLDGSVQTETRHSWQPARTAPESALSFPVQTQADALALMELENILENKPWIARLLPVRTDDTRFINSHWDQSTPRAGHRQSTRRRCASQSFP